MSSITRGLRITVFVLTLLIFAFSVIAAIGRGAASVPARSWLLLAAAAVLLVVAWIRRRDAVGPWLCMASLAMVLLMGFIDPGGPQAGEFLVMGCYTIAYLGILLSSRRAGLAWIIIGVLLQVLVSVQFPSLVEVASITVNLGWIAAFQMVVTGVWLWVVWHGLLGDAAERDADDAQRRREIAASLGTQERAQAWREAITRTHETVLNDLRYVLRAPELDRTRLAEQLRKTKMARERLPVPLPTVATLIASMRPSLGMDVVVEDRSRPDDLADPQAVSTALAEILRNIDRHSGAHRVDIEVATIGDRLHITIVDDGDADWGSDDPGIGLSIILGEMLAESSIEMTRSPHRVEMSARLPARESRRSRREVNASLRVLVAVVLASSALGGSPQFVLLLAGGAWSYLPVVALAVLVTALATVVAMRQRVVSLGVIAVAGACAAAIPVVLLAAEPPCGNEALIRTTLNLTVNAFFAILLWAPRRVAWFAVIPVVAAVLAPALIPNAPCSVPVGNLLANSILLMPLFIAVSWYAARVSERYRAADVELWRRQVRESSRAEVELDLARDLEGRVDEAWALMSEVAQGAELTAATRHRLRTLESSIRAVIQVDPRASGGMVHAARRIVQAAVDRGVPVHVRALRGSQDPRPLPEEIESLLLAILVESPDVLASIQVFNDGVDDYLTVSTMVTALDRVGYSVGEIREFPDGIVEADLAGDDEQHERDAATTDAGSREAVVMVSRTVPVGSLSAVI